MPTERCSKMKILLFRRIFVWTSILSLSIIIIITLASHEDELTPEYGSHNDYSYEASGDSFIDSDNCKIPNINPFSRDAMSVFRTRKYEKCHKLTPFTSIQYDTDGIRLIINEKVQNDHFSWWQNAMDCCYQRITRAGHNATADKEYKLSSCVKIISGQILQKDDEFIMVTCKGYRNIFAVRNIKVQMYKHAHAIIVGKNKSHKKSNSNQTNVLLIGIDSISRLNIIRAMPRTYKYLKDKHWFEMNAFTKVGDNTFPNLMAILTGNNLTTIKETCNWKKVGELEKCRFLWDDFKDSNYITAYAEDVMKITTFNYYETGFVRQPTDYYLRPFALAAEQNLNSMFHPSWEIKCVGFEHYADIVFKYGLDFAFQHKNDPHFGLFWTNSFSHEDLSSPSEYDIRMIYYLEEMEKLKVFENSIVIFFSDHGMRFGDIRKYYTGWMEERLPFLFISIPESFKLNHPDLVENLRINTKRLISPYDLHITMKHILNLSPSSNGEPRVEQSAFSCPTCMSLFEEVPKNRTCSDAGIDKQWCACTEYKESNRNSHKVEMAVNYAVDALNNDLMKYKQCAKLKLNEVTSARESKHGNTTDYLISFEVSPSKGQMESTIRCDDVLCKKIEIIGEISRINLYGNQSWCIKDEHLRKYCYCI